MNIAYKLVSDMSNGDIGAAHLPNTSTATDPFWYGMTIAKMGDRLYFAYHEPVKKSFIAIPRDF